MMPDRYHAGFNNLMATMYQLLAARTFARLQNALETGDWLAADYWQREASRDYRVARWYLFGETE